MIIAQISDTHISLDAPDAEQRIEDFEAVVRDINSLNPLPDLVIHTGDIVHNGRVDEYARSTEILSKANVPVYGMVGNKDDRRNMREAFSRLQSVSPDSAFIEYTVDGFPVKLLMLDTLHEGSNKGYFCEERLQNLNAMINQEPDRPIAVFTHHPPCEITVGPNLIHFEAGDAMPYLQKALLSSGQVISVFSGHVHRSTTGVVEDIPVNVATAVATPLRRGEYPDHMENRPVYCLHRYDETVGFVTETRIAGD
ncbi:MAG: metallophosphoesterase [Rhizobiaceae bacterium]